MKPPEVIFIDECHLLAPNSEFWKFLKKNFPNAKIFGFTTTPYRGDQHISTFGWKSIFNISILDLVKEKFLVPPRSMGTGSEIVISGNDRQRTNLLLDPDKTECLVYDIKTCHARRRKIRRQIRGVQDLEIMVRYNFEAFQQSLHSRGFQVNRWRELFITGSCA